MKRLRLALEIGFAGILIWMAIGDFRNRDWTGGVLFFLMGITFFYPTWKALRTNR